MIILSTPAFIYQNNHTSTNRTISAELGSQFYCGKENSAVVSHKKFTKTVSNVSQSVTVQNRASNDMVGVSFVGDLNWHKNISSVTVSAAKKLDFPFLNRKYFSKLNALQISSWTIPFYVTHSNERCSSYR